MFDNQMPLHNVSLFLCLISTFFAVSAIARGQYVIHYNTVQQ